MDDITNELDQYSNLLDEKGDLKRLEKLSQAITDGIRLSEQRKFI